MKKFIASILSLILCLTLASCGKADYTQITPQKAKEMMEQEEEYILLDVRTQVEHNLEYIDGSIVIPHKEIRDRAENELPDKNAVILVYCATGVRSKKAAETLADMGYENVYEFGGIDAWQYGTVKE